MHHALPLLALAAFVLSVGPSFAASPAASLRGGAVSLNPQPLPPVALEGKLLRKPPVCLSCPQSGLRLPGSDRSLNPQPLPPRLYSPLVR